MKMLRSLLLAMPCVGICGPALAGAGQLTGNYLLTITASHGGGTQGQQSCVTLNEDGSLLHWVNSGTVSINNGSATGSFFVSGSNLLATASAGSTTFIFTGFLHKGSILPAQFETFNSGVAVDSGLFTVVRGGC
jgi:hypothetical protein